MEICFLSKRKCLYVQTFSIYLSLDWDMSYQSNELIFKSVSGKSTHLEWLKSDKNISSSQILKSRWDKDFLKEVLKWFSRWITQWLSYMRRIIFIQIFLWCRLKSQHFIKLESMWFLDKLLNDQELSSCLMKNCKELTIKKSLILLKLESSCSFPCMIKLKIPFLSTIEYLTLRQIKKSFEFTEKIT